MAGRRVAGPGEPRCPVRKCRRPAGLATATPGHGPCLRHGGITAVPAGGGGDPVEQRVTGRGSAAASPEGVLRVVLATGAQAGFAFEHVWPLATRTALAFTDEEQAREALARFEADERAYRTTYAQRSHPATPSAR